MTIRVILLLALLAFLPASASAQEVLPAPITLPEASDESVRATEPPQTDLVTEALRRIPERGRARNDPPVSDLPPEEIPPEYLAEMDQVYKDCASHSFRSKFKDCECYAMKLLDKRIEAGPEPALTHLLFELEGTCVNQPGIAGYAYGNCTEHLMMRNIPTYEQICTCYANTVAKNTARLPRINSVNLISVRRNAFIACGLNEAEAQRNEKMRNTYRAR